MIVSANPYTRRWNRLTNAVAASESPAAMPARRASSETFHTVIYAIGASRDWPPVARRPYRAIPRGLRAVVPEHTERLETSMRALPRTTRRRRRDRARRSRLRASVASPAMAKSKPPVKLDGKVNNKGVGAATSGTVEIELDNYYFKKTFVKAPAGSVTVELKNEGSVQHTFTIDDQDIDVELAPGAVQDGHRRRERYRADDLLLQVPRGPGHAGRAVRESRRTGAKTKSDSKSSGPRIRLRTIPPVSRFGRFAVFGIAKFQMGVTRCGAVRGRRSRPWGGRARGSGRGCCACCRRRSART